MTDVSPATLGQYRRVVGFLASRLNPIDRLECEHEVACTRNGSTEAHAERCAECER